MSNVAQLNLQPSRLLLDRNTPWRTAEVVVGQAPVPWRFAGGKWWQQIPDEGQEDRGPSGALVWVEMDKEEVRQAVYQLMATSDADEGNGIREPFAPKKRDVDQVMDALRARLYGDGRG